MNIETVIGSAHRCARARLGVWPYEPDVAQIILLDHHMRPTVADVRGWAGDAAAGGHHTIRTGALFPDATAVFRSAGFSTIDELALFQAAIDDIAVDTSGARLLRRQTTSRMRNASLPSVAELDRAAFGDPWGNDERSLSDITTATPRHRARVVRGSASSDHTPGHPIDAFAISGQSGRFGYLQRLAVRQQARRNGLANELVRDAVTWMKRRGATHVMVNTAVDNQAALNLYTSLGFQRLPDSLFIMELTLP